MDKPNYEDLERLYNEASTGNVEPQFAVTNLSSARQVWGDEQVEAMIEDGTIRFMKGFEGVVIIGGENG